MAKEYEMASAAVAAGVGQMEATAKAATLACWRVADTWEAPHRNPVQVPGTLVHTTHAHSCHACILQTKDGWVRDTN